MNDNEIQTGQYEWESAKHFIRYRHMQPATTKEYYWTDGGTASNGVSNI